MRKTTYLLIGLLLWLMPYAAFAAYESEVEKAMVGRAMEGQRMIFARDYSKAVQIFGQLEKEYPEHPIGYFGQMAALEMQMLEKEGFHLAGKFEDLAKRGQKAIISTFNRRPSDWDLLVCGSLMGLEGFYKARQRQWWDAYSLGVKSRQTFKRIKKRNPEFYDADFGLGMYLYWRSVFTKEISFLSMFPDKRAEGIAIVTQVVEKGHFARDLAEANLGMMWLEEKRFDKAHAIFEKYSDRYPNNILFYQFDARALIGGKRYGEAAAQLIKLKKVDPSIHKADYFLGLARVLQKDPQHYDQAEAAFKAFLKHASKGEWKAATNYWLGILEEQRGNKVLAKQYYETALKENPQLKTLKFRLRGMGSGL